jgi:hypothetical protein
LHLKGKVTKLQHINSKQDCQVMELPILSVLFKGSRDNSHNKFNKMSEGSRHLNTQHNVIQSNGVQHNGVD